MGGEQCLADDRLVNGLELEGRGSFLAPLIGYRKDSYSAHFAECCLFGGVKKDVRHTIAIEQRREHPPTGHAKARPLEMWRSFYTGKFESNSSKFCGGHARDGGQLLFGFSAAFALLAEKVSSACPPNETTPVIASASNLPENDIVIAFPL